VEVTVRKLLLASQKSGVGTTTTAINLAAATAQAGARVLLIDADPVGSISAALDVAQRGRRCELRELGINLPGAMWRDVLPGLDVLCPFDEGLCRDEDLEAVLAGLEGAKGDYRCVLVDTSPFMGDRPRHLLRHCDEFVLVMRAEAVAFRTLPLFFETVKAIQSEDGGVALRGILLTQPAPGKWELDLRRYLGSRAFPKTIPSDPEVEKSAANGRPLMVHNAQTPAARLYQELGSSLELATAAPLLAGKATGRETARPDVSGRRSLPRPGQEPDPGLKRTRSRPVVAVPAGDARNAVAGPSRGKAVRKRGQIRPWQMWIGAGMVSGTFLGSVRSPEHILPCAVGLATTAGFVLAMKFIGKPEKAKKKR
jgi:chromosome partitioning protein